MCMHQRQYLIGHGYMVVNKKLNSHENFLGQIMPGTVSLKAGHLATLALALCYSVAKYATPVCSKCKHAHLLDPELNQACRVITGSQPM